MDEPEQKDLKTPKPDQPPKKPAPPEPDDVIDGADFVDEDAKPQPEEPQPEVDEDLEADLDKDELKPDIVAVESQPDEDAEAEAENTPPTAAPVVSPSKPSSTTITINAPGSSSGSSKGSSGPSLQINPPKKEGKRNIFKSKKFWVVIVLLLIAGAVAAWFVQPSRVWIVNTLGMRVNVEIDTETQAATGQQASLLKNVAIDINGTKYSSGDAGKLTANIPYGDTKITASKSGYDNATQIAFYDFNPFFYLLGIGNKKGDDDAKHITLQLKGVGEVLSFKAVDWLTGNGVTMGQFSVGDVIGKPDSQGMVTLNIPPTDDATVKVHASFAGMYNDQDITVAAGETFAQQKFTFVPGGKEYFLSKRSGVLSVYSSDVDGSNTAEIVKGTGQETAATAIAVSPSGKYLALSSSREGQRDSTNTMLQKLYIVNLTDNKLTAVDEGQFINFADWSGDTLVYSVGERLPKATETTQRLASVDVTSGKKTDLASASYFSAVRVSLANVVYVLGFASGDNAANSPELRTISVKGGSEKNLAFKVGTLTQTELTNFVYQTSDNAWHSYNSNTSQVGNTSTPQSLSRAFLNPSSPDGQNQLIIDRTDGKVTLIKKSKADGKETTLYSAAGITGPYRWLASNVIVFRITDSSQSADYVVSQNGGQPKKISDVTATTSAFTAGVNYLPFY